MYNILLVGMIISWRNHRGDFNSVVQPIADIKVDARNQSALYEKKWIRIDRSADLMEGGETKEGEQYEFFWVVMVEINSTQFMKSSKKRNLDHRFTSVLVVWCLSLATIKKLGLKAPYDMAYEEMISLCDYFFPEDMSPSWVVEVPVGIQPAFHALRLKPEFVEQAARSSGK
jgi:hypothetical protein